MLIIIFLKLLFRVLMTAVSFETLLNVIVLKQRVDSLEVYNSFVTMLNMIVLKPRNMLFIKIIVFHKILKTLLYE